ncbi:TP53-regulated inhibitor of apoptosis 1-like [Drosophila gunungcola]|uniref:TP53-regulated inhibitor of apoptosis 1-like n=1 Tax=Drosophila gunungcola TaxID=103775 RepID=UPI0022E449D4|nr:TP53-regulated inhibitor of apoptosis 1-like [Drosophila gunungcola]
MSSVGEDCNELKQQYDACFNNWFSERFLKGQTDDSACAPIFRIYQECVKRAIREKNINLQEIDPIYETDSEHDQTTNSTGNQQQKAKS